MASLEVKCSLISPLIKLLWSEERGWSGARGCSHRLFSELAQPKRRWWNPVQCEIWTALTQPCGPLAPQLRFLFWAGGGNYTSKCLEAVDEKLFHEEEFLLPFTSSHFFFHAFAFFHIRLPTGFFASSLFCVSFPHCAQAGPSILPVV